MNIDEKRIKRAIAYIQSTHFYYIEIEEIQELGGDERKVFCKMKGFKYTALMRGYIVLAIMARI